MDEKSKSIEKKSASATKWSLLTEIFARLATPIANMILARLLLPEAFGLVATITMVLSFAEIFTDAGFQKYIIQHEFNNNETFMNAIQVAFWSNVIFAFVISAVIFLLRTKIADSVGNDRLGFPIAIAGLTILFNAVSSVHIGVFRRQFEYKRLFYIRFVVSLVPIIITVPAAYILHSFWALIIGNIAKSIVQAMLIIPMSKIGIRFYYSMHVFRKMFAFSFWTIVESIFIWLTSNIDVFIIGKILDSYYLGLYKTAISTISTYIGIIAAAITSVLFSTLSRFQNDKENFLNTYFRFQRKLAVILLPCGVIVCVFRELVTKILLGKQWLTICDFLGMYALVNVFVVEICYFISEVFRSKGQPKISVIYQIIFIVLETPAIYFAANRGFVAMCNTRCVLGLLYIIVALLFGQILYDIKIINIMKNLFPQTVSVFIMGLLGMILVRLSNKTYFQIGSILLCIIAYLGCLMCFKSFREEYVSYFKRIYGR